MEFSPHQRAVLERRIQNDDLLATAVKLLNLQARVSMESADRLFGRDTVEELVDIGMLDRTGHSVSSFLGLTPVRDFFVFHDQQQEDNDIRHDFVMGPSAGSLLLANLTERKKRSNTLDLGTGCGIHALLAAEHGGRVVATEANERAVDLARFNALVNGLTNIEIRHGNWFEPVENEKFDAVFSLPPSVLSPDNNYQFRDTADAADNCCRNIVSQVPDHLTELGVAHLAFDWACQGTNDWESPIREWVRDNGCDVWLGHIHTRDPLSYASWYANVLQYRGATATAYGERIDAWLEYYRQLKINAIASGVLMLRKRSCGNNWFSSGHMASSGHMTLRSSASVGSQIAALFSAQDFLHQDFVDTDLLSYCFRVSPQTRIDNASGFSDKRVVNDRLFLGLENGVLGRVKLAPGSETVLVFCDGSQSFRSILERLA
ncbi:MAG: methyltransferase, partial [Gammaproteobacteria bacterium]